MISFPSSTPQSCLCLLSACVSSRNKSPLVMPHIRTKTQTKFGSRNGYVSKRDPFGKSHGYASQGEASAPPMAGPMMEPKHHTNGMIEYALGWCSFLVTSSATV